MKPSTTGVTTSGRDEGWADHPDGRRSRLRALLTDLAGTVTQMRSAATVSAIDAVGVAVAELTSALDLGAEPELMACPVCTRLGMQGANRCGFCWTSLRQVG